jgi:hypothetical protein
VKDFFAKGEREREKNELKNYGRQTRVLQVTSEICFVVFKTSLRDGRHFNFHHGG